MRAFPLCWVVACGAPATSGPTAPTPTSTPTTTSAASAAPAAAAPSKVEWQTWTREASADAAFITASPVPTEQEWNNAKAATIWGLDKTQCSAKQTERWLRVECPGSIALSDGKPFQTSGGNGAWQARWTSERTVLLLPLAPGLYTDLFTAIGEDSLMLNLEWRFKMPRPPVLGYANDASSPACDGKLAPAGAVAYSKLEDCRRSDESCEQILQCLSDSPQHLRSCPPGYEEVAFQCATACSADSDCATGWHCHAASGYCMNPS